MLIAFLATNTAYGTTITALPSTYDAGRYQEQLKEEQEQPPVSVDAYPAQSNESAVPKIDSSQDFKFMLRSLEVNGVTAFPEEKIKQIYATHLGKVISLSKLFYVVKQITDMYWQEGYTLSRAILPEQDIKSGEIVINVVEGYIEQLEITGFAKDDSLVKSVIEPLQGIRPVKTAVLENKLLILNGLPTVLAKAILAPSDGKEDGALFLKITTESKPHNAALHFNNYGSDYIGRNQLAANVGINGVFYKHLHSDVLVSGLQPSSKVKSLAINNSIPINSSGTELGANFSYSKVNPAFVLKSTDITSNANNLAFSITHPVIRSRIEKFNLLAELAINNIQSDIMEVKFYNDKIRALRLGMNYNNIDTYAGMNDFAVTYSKGLKLMGASRNNRLNLSKAKGKVDFNKIEANVSRLQDLKQSFSLYAQAKSQYSFSPLLSSEQFGYGGQSIGKAYDSSELTGDQGLSALLELRYNDTQLIQNNVMQYFAFYDRGKLWNKGQNHMTGASLGLGARYFNPNYFTSSFTVAKPLIYNNAINKLKNKNKPVRLFISLTAQI